jgi:dodecin
MAVAKVIEITSGSPEGFEDAIRQGLATAAETLDDIQGAWVKEQNVRLERGEIAEYRVTMKVTFMVRGEGEHNRGGTPPGRSTSGRR